MCTVGQRNARRHQSPCCLGVESGGCGQHREDSPLPSRHLTTAGGQAGSPITLLTSPRRVEAPRPVLYPSPPTCVRDAGYYNAGLDVR